MFQSLGLGFRGLVSFTRVFQSLGGRGWGCGWGGGGGCVPIGGCRWKVYRYCFAVLYSGIVWFGGTRRSEFTAGLVRRFVGASADVLHSANKEDVSSIGCRLQHVDSHVLLRMFDCWVLFEIWGLGLDFWILFSRQGAETWDVGYLRL